MTLGKHEIKGITLNQVKPMPASTFEKLMVEAGYFKFGSVPTFQSRWFVYFEHSAFGRVEAVYSPDKKVVITAYHPD